VAKSKSVRNKPSSKLKQAVKTIYGWLLKILPKNKYLRYAVVSVTTVILLCVAGMYIIAQWYIFTQKNKPTELGVTYIANYAEWLGVDPKETLNAILTELKPARIRLVSYWDVIQPNNPDEYNFSELDYQFEQSHKAGTKVSLAIGLRQPRWPECHGPKWADVDNRPMEQWYPELKQFMKTVIERYKNHPALESYQLENEYFLKVFGECTNFSRDRLIDEYNFVKSLDASHTVIVSRSNNWVGIPVGKPRPDLFGISVYKRVWDRTFTKRYLEYPYPAWYYAFYAGAGQILTGKNLMIHELQAEPWMPDGIPMKDSTTEEQYKSMSPQRLKARFEYARATGMKQIDYWGAEWWYWRKVKFNDPEIWNVAINEFAQHR
jgi:hypothetical protein